MQKNTSSRILVNNALIYLGSALKDYPCDALQNEVEDLRAQNESRHYVVAVAGDFKRGKSSLINALLGIPVLPMGVEPMTATLNRIVYGSAPKVLIEKKDDTVIEIDMSELADYVTKSGIHLARTIREAVIEYPTVLCQNGIDILDTPGLNDDEEMTAVAKEALHHAHAAVVAVSAKLLFSQTESEWAAELIAYDKLEYLIFAVTYIDCIPKRQRQRLLDYLRQRIHDSVMTAMQQKYSGQEQLIEKAERLVNPETMVLIPVSPVDALDAFDNGDNDLLQESNLPEFKKKLFALLTAQQEEYTLGKARKMLSLVSEWLQQNNDILIADDMKNSQNMQWSETALASLLYYPDNVRLEIENMVNIVNEQINKNVSSYNTAYNAMNAALSCVLSGKFIYSYTQSALQSLLSRAAQEAVNAAQYYYLSEFVNTIYPIFAQTLFNIVSRRNDLYDECAKILDESALITPTEELKLIGNVSATSFLPTMPQNWSLSVSGTVMTDIAKGVGTLKDSFVNMMGSKTNKQTEQKKKSKSKTDSLMNNGMVKGIKSRAAGIPGLNKDIYEMVSPQLAKSALLLHQQWKDIPRKMESFLIAAFVDQEDPEKTHYMETELYRKIGEYSAATAAIQKSNNDYQEAMKYVQMAENALK